MTSKRKTYEFPASEVVEMRMQGMLCGSKMSTELTTDLNVTYGQEDW